MKTKVTKEFTKALNRAFVLLKFRKRSPRELRARLEAKGFGSTDIDAVLAYLEEKRYTDSQAHSETEEAAEMARQAAVKLKNLAPERARKRLFSYLSSRGFSSDVISETINKTM